ncbi:hypothetical protein K4Q97_03085 [Staphylococcus epidermidis]|uniref:hypothetical protein n=1 Tax=Staphylococcus epidermidis TaxID=1282 RepID=UPI00273F0FE3|nr:hypothetical protein [Staphylococcus epidermidis]MCG2097645.1 hypothetical protein [Staphylococcus epidermidis]MCG2273611.1 hypothetical protein [Staphylococcus epidermidis]MCG2309879.1 hypothetical protein [Staphylococcus epidermidis]MDS0933307.1 hypothetical protein [Staphylococcus epidermidis]
MDFLQQNWANILKIIVSLISIVTFIRVFLYERSRLKVNIIGYDQMEEYLDVYISFSNSSKLPISINEIQIFHKNTMIGEIENFTEKILGQPDGKSIVYSNPMPLNLNSYSSDKDLFRIKLVEKLPLNKTLTFKFITTRKNITYKIKDFKLPQYRMSFHTKLEHHKKVSNKNKD